MAFFYKYSCQPKGYISEGEITIDAQSNESATLQMITIREILPQFTMIGPNQNSTVIFWVFHLDYLSISAYGVPLVIVKLGLFYRHGGSREHRPLVFPQYNLAYNHFCHREHWAVFVWHYMEYQYSLLGNPINEGSHHHPRLQAANLSFRLTVRYTHRR